MALSIQLGYPDVPKSITNPNVKLQNVLDKDSPMSFLTFIKTIAVSFEPDSLQNYYTYYLKEWNGKNNRKDEDNNSIIVERYRDFIKDISLNYTTLEERVFLSKINFNDPYDLDIAIGFYSKKLKEIAQYYNSKREDVKFEITKKKILGTNQGIGNKILELSLNYLENLQDGPILYDINSIKSQIEVELEELFDGYPYYFNQIPDETVYDKKDLDYNEDIFLKSNAELIATIFAGVSDEIKKLKEVDQLFDTKRVLSRNSVSTDFYYLSTGSTVTDFVSGVLFEATAAAQNLVNRKYPTTASTPQTVNLKTPHQVGFFTPAKNGMLFLDGTNSRFEINFANLQPNSIYYFADPTITGVNGEVLVFYADDSLLKRNFSSGKANNQPIQTDDGASYNGYVSKLNPKEITYFDEVFDKGYISDAKKDIYNNLFGLFKIDPNFNEVIENVSTNVIKSLQFNGHTFYDLQFQEGFQFNYNTYDDATYLETLRSSLTSYSPTFNTLSSFYTLFFRNFKPYEELVEPRSDDLNIEYIIRDGAFFRKNDGTAYDDPISSDLNAFPGSGVYYFSELLESGIHDASPIQRALVDPLYPTLTAVFHESVRPNGSNGVEYIDGGNFTDNFDFEFSLTEQPYEFNGTLLSSTRYVLPSADNSYYNERRDLVGQMFIQNGVTRRVAPLLNTLPYLTSRHPATVWTQLSSKINRFELAYDTLFIQTSSYLVIEKTKLEDGVFVDPKTVTYSLSHDTGAFNRITNRFKKGNNVYYAILRTSSDYLSTNNFKVYPEIYRFDLVNFKNDKVFPLTQAFVTDFFNISGGDIRYVIADTPTITYSSRNNLFNVSFLLKDQNNLLYLHEYDFDESPNIKFVSHKAFKPTNDQVSNIFNSSYQSNLTFFLSSGTASIQLSSEELVL